MCRMNKNEMFPRLCYLSTQVHSTLLEQSEEQRQMLIKRNRASLQLSIAQEVINELQVVKHGRRGKPHETRLMYDPSHPLVLHWRSKNGIKSSQKLHLNLVEGMEMGIVTSVLKKSQQEIQNGCGRLLVVGHPGTHIGSQVERFRTTRLACKCIKPSHRLCERMESC